MNADERRLRLLFLALALLTLCGFFVAAQEKKPLPNQPLDLNAAKVEELRQLPEVGRRLAEAIVRFREKSGPFKRVEELLAIPGITKRRLEKIRPHVYVKPKEVSGSKQPSTPAGKAKSEPSRQSH